MTPYLYSIYLDKADANIPIIGYHTWLFTTTPEYSSPGLSAGKAGRGLMVDRLWTVPGQGPRNFDKHSLCTFCRQSVYTHHKTNGSQRNSEN